MQAHKGLTEFTEYLRRKFPWKQDFYCEMVEESFTYGEVKEALKLLKATDPTLHKYLQYRTMSNRSRSEIADALYLDSSTIKRRWDRAQNILMNWLLHGIKEDLFEPLDKVDLVTID